MADIYIELDARADADARRIAKEILQVTKAFPKVVFKMDASLDSTVVLTAGIPKRG